MALSGTLYLSEKPYVSIQGEGRFVGIPMLFVRLQGCHVGCKWCDSYYTWHPFNQEKTPNPLRKQANASAFDVTFRELDKLIEESGVQHVWITGGEPMLQKLDLGAYIRTSHANVYFHICTSGQIFDREIALRTSFITIDVKAPSSGVRHTEDVAKWLTQKYIDLECKMVVANNKKDKDFAIEMISKYPDKPWTLQPLYYSEPAVNADSSKLAELNGWKLDDFAKWVNDNFKQYEYVRMGLQLHKHLFPTQSRGI